jgi:hypothetical protein
MMMQMKENADKYAVASARKTEENYLCVDLYTRTMKLIYEVAKKQQSTYSNIQENEDKNVSLALLHMQILFSSCLPDEATHYVLSKKPRKKEATHCVTQ